MKILGEITDNSKMLERDDLDIEKYPKEFQDFLAKEMELVKEFVQKDDKILDIGCGAGRAIPQIAPLVSEHIGIDIDNEYLKQSRDISKQFKNVKIFELNVENLSSKFKENEFDKSFSLFNTISCFKNYEKALKEIYRVTKNKFYFSVCAKGAKEIRQKYYDMIGIKATFDKNETAYSSAWDQVIAFNEKEIRDVCEKIGFKIDKITLFEGYAYGIIVSK